MEGYAQGGRASTISRVYPTEAIFEDARVFLFNNATGASVTAKSVKIWQMNSTTSFLDGYPGSLSPWGINFTIRLHVLHWYYHRLAYFICTFDALFLYHGRHRRHLLKVKDCCIWVLFVAIICIIFIIKVSIHFLLISVLCSAYCGCWEISCWEILFTHTSLTTTPCLSLKAIKDYKSAINFYDHV